MEKKELEDKVGIAFTTLTKETTTPELIALQHDLRKTQPEDKDYLQLVLLELRWRDKKHEMMSLALNAKINKEHQ